jgi:hypothetical protein
MVLGEWDHPASSVDQVLRENMSLAPAMCLHLQATPALTLYLLKSVT